MSRLYAHVGVTRQSLSQALRRHQAQEVILTLCIKLVVEIRRDHPRMGLRKIHGMLQVPGMGRDRFIATMCEQGLQLSPHRSTMRTTHSQRILREPNLCKGLILNDIHQLWVTDITYFRLPEHFVYIVTILEVYTRLILAAVASQTLRAEANVAALRQALRRTTTQREGKQTIHHSDYGVQYIAREYRALLDDHHFRISMCEEAWENPYAERVQGIMKNEYLAYRSIRTFPGLQRELSRTVRLYNTERPHGELPGRMSPVAFARWIASMPEAERPVMILDDTPSASSLRLTARRDAQSSMEAPARRRPPDAAILPGASDTVISSPGGGTSVAGEATKVSAYESNDFMAR